MKRILPKQDEEIRGDSIYLRQLGDSDFTNNYLNWLKDKSINQYLESRHTSHSKESLISYINYCNKSENNFLFGVFTKVENEHIGNIKLGDIDWKNQNANIGIIIGEKDFWGKGIATTAIQLLTSFAFTNLQLTSLCAGCYEENFAAKKAFLKSGWKLSGVYPKWRFNSHMQLTDLFIYTISRIND